jgi:hypothetical protein
VFVCVCVSYMQSCVLVCARVCIGVASVVRWFLLSVGHPCPSDPLRAVPYVGGVEWVAPLVALVQPVEQGTAGNTHTHTHTPWAPCHTLFTDHDIAQDTLVGVHRCVCLPQAMFDWYDAPASERFNFMTFMQGSVARVVRKPVQVAFAMDHVQVHVCVRVCVCV